MFFWGESVHRGREQTTVGCTVALCNVNTKYIFGSFQNYLDQTKTFWFRPKFPFTKNEEKILDNSAPISG